MKKMKLSNKLIIAFLIFILGIIGYQVIVSEKVISDTKTLKEKQSPEELLIALKNTEIYKSTPISSIEKFEIFDNLCVEFLKGKKSEIYYTDYSNVQVEIGKDKVIMKNKESATLSMNGARPIFIFLEKEPESIIFKGNNKSNGFRSVDCSVYGLNGSGLLLENNNGYVNLETDMRNVRILQNNRGNLTISSSTMDEKQIMPEMQVSAEVNQGKISLRGNKKLTLLNANILLNEGNFDVEVAGGARLGNLMIKGKVYGMPKKNVENLKKVYAYSHDDFYSSRIISSEEYCDSLLIDLECDKDKSYRLYIPKNLKAGFEEIRCSDNIYIEKN